LGTIRAILTFISDVRGLEELDHGAQTTILKRTFDGVGGAAPRILDEIDAGAPMYFSAVGQLSNRSWIKGRIALLGDAASCNATFGGAGTSLALIGGYVLAGDLDGAADVPSALARYQRVMEPFVDDAPRVRADVLRLANPRTRTGIRVLHAGARLAASRAVRTITAVTGKGLISIANSSPLPDYPDKTDVRLP
jgi:2-polyprenyl-6-methoxyphenol hydroxylase-like FAD-dependent oxidoreductase